MAGTAALKVTTQGDREIVMTRAFDAPRRLVYEAYTKPEHLKRWLLGPDGWSMPSCEIDLRVGGKYRYVWRHDKNGTEFGIAGVYREIVPPERIVASELMDGFPHEAVTTAVLTEHNGVTTLTLTILYATREDREAALKSGMEHGVAASYNRLAALLPTLEKGALAS